MAESDRAFYLRVAKQYEDAAAATNNKAAKEQYLRTAKEQRNFAAQCKS